MNAEIVVCTINVSRIYNVDTDVSRNGGTYCIRGAVTIRKLNDTNYLFQFESECRSHAMVAVLENVVLLKDRKIFQVIVEENLVSFTTDSTAKYELFEEAVLECRMLSELVLRLDAVCRDVYYAGIYASSAANESDLMLSKELQILRDSQVVTSGFNIFALSANKHKNIDVLNIKEGDGEGNSLSISSKTSMDISSNIVCIFCSAQKSNEITEKFAVHPYVPLTFKKEEIYMCLRCMHNWKDYREKAVLDCQLVLEGELNEELCGKCLNWLDQINFKFSRTYDQNLHLQ